MHFANLSGGRDSSAMVVRWLESGQRLEQHSRFTNAIVAQPTAICHVEAKPKHLKDSHKPRFSARLRFQPPTIPESDR